MPKRHFCLFVTVTKCADEKENCHSLSVCGAIQIQCRQSYKYIRFGRPYCYFRLLIVVKINGAWNGHLVVLYHTHSWHSIPKRSHEKAVPYVKQDFL